MKKYEEAEQIFKECLEIKSTDTYTIFELAKLYVKKGNLQEAENMFKKRIEINNKDIFARFELGKLYLKQGKEQEAEEVLKECLEIDPKDVYVRMELGKLYAIQGKDDLSKDMYDYILEQMEGETLGKESREKHILKHMTDDKTKENHGIFIKNPIDLLEEIKKQMTKENKCIKHMADIYLIK